MAVSRNLTVVFMAFYVAVILYMFLFLLVPDFQESIMESRQDIAEITKGTNYIWAILIAIGICLIGNASIGFPVPFPFVLFSFSNSIYLRYSAQGLALEQIMASAPFWLEIMGIALAGGFGSALGEFTSFFLGRGAKLIAAKSESEIVTLNNVEGFGRLVLENPHRMYFYIFVAAALPIPDDPLWIAMGMTERKLNYGKCILYGWLGKNVTTFAYVCLPILIILGIAATGVEVNDTSSVISESIMLLATLTIMFFILAFDWNKYIENKQLEAALEEEE